MDAPSALGKTTHWKMQVQGSIRELLTRGWTAVTIRPGDLISVSGFPVKQNVVAEPDSGIGLVEVTLPNGMILDATSQMWMAPKLAK